MTLDQRISDPVAQAVLISAGALALMLIGWVLNVSGLFMTDSLYPWSISAAFSLLFAMLNSLMSLRADNFARYWGRSMYAYLGSAFTMGLAAWLFSGIPLRDAGTYRSIYIVVSVGFVVFLTMVNIIKRIVRYAEREEWNQPRRK